MDGMQTLNKTELGTLSSERFNDPHVWIVARFAGIRKEGLTL